MTSKLALWGGDRVINEDHGPHIKWPLIESDDVAAVTEVLLRGSLSNDTIRVDLEDAYKKYIGRTYALTHCNGTTALLAAFFAVGLTAGDEVLVTSATWWSSVVPLFWLGVLPVFCENEVSQLGICTDDLEKKITPRTRAIVMVHLFGIPSRVDEIKKLAQKYDLKIIEDASHAHGAEWEQKKCGQFGDVSVFSLQGDKLAPAGEGGILLTDNQTYFENAVCLGDVNRIGKLESEAKFLAATSFGIKSRMAALSAALGLSQLNKLDRNNQRRRENTQYLSKHLETLGFETYLFDSKSTQTNLTRTYFEFLIRWKIPQNMDPEVFKKLGREPLISALKAEGVRAELPRYPLLHKQPLFTKGLWQKIARLPSSIPCPDYSCVRLPQTESTNQELIKLPHFSTATKEFLDLYIRAFEKVMSEIPKLYQYS